MTREEAIYLLNNLRSVAEGKEDEAIYMAIEALSADGVGRYENAMQKLREMPKYLNGVKEKQIKKISANEVVRCKDCRFWKNEHLCLVMSRYGSVYTKAEHYCSWGERREP